MTILDLTYQGVCRTRCGTFGHEPDARSLARNAGTTLTVSLPIAHATL
jgi:hypothetical protein